MNSKKTQAFLIGAVAVLALAFAGLVMSSLGKAVPAGSQDPASASSPVITATAGMAPSTGSAFDAKTATRAEGNSPAAHVALYYKDLKSGDYAGAFALQPAASRAGGDAAAFGRTQKSYGMVSYAVASPVVTGNEAIIAVSQDLGSNGKWTVTWSFRKSGGTWYVESRQVAMDSATPGTATTP